jgi:hypothetical protein
MLGFSIKNLFISNKPVDILLDPLTTIFRLCIIGLKSDGIKISIKDNGLHHQSNNPVQGIIRWVRGDTKEMLGNLHKPICLYIMRYKNMAFAEQLNKYAIGGLCKLKSTYKKHHLIEHSLRHYIKLMETLNLDNEMTNQDEKYFELYDVWTESEIKLCFFLLKEYLNSSQEATLKALNEILDGKDVLLRDVIIR